MRLLSAIFPIILVVSAAPAPADRLSQQIQRDENPVSGDGPHLEPQIGAVQNDDYKRDYLNLKDANRGEVPTITAFVSDKPANTALAKRKDKVCKAKTTSMPSCTMQNEDPDQGINSAHCICEGTTLPLLTTTHITAATQSCEYSSIPTTGIITTKAHLGTATTNTKICQVCTPVVNNEDECSIMKNCVVMTGAATVVAGTSPVHVGTVTGSALYTGVSKALETLCPSVTKAGEMTSCDEESTAKIKDVPYVDSGFLSTGGEIDVKVASGSYNLTSLRDAMIKSAALTAMHAAEKKCYTADYETEAMKKRDDESWWSKLLPAVVKRGDRMEPTRVDDVTWCNTIQYVSVNYYDPWWREVNAGATDHIDVNLSFKTDGDGAFACELLEGLADGLIAVAPEFAVGELELGEAIDIACEKAEGL
jgi:hypothetical protein